MIEDQTISQEPTQTPTEPIVPASKFGKLLEKIPTPIKNLFAKFYENKKIFWPVTGAAGAIFLILILGLIFGKRQMAISTTKPSPTQSQNQATSVPSTPDQLQQIQMTLGKIKDQITNLDVTQAPLQPPGIDFKISF